MQAPIFDWEAEERSDEDVECVPMLDAAWYKERISAIKLSDYARMSRARLESIYADLIAQAIIKYLIF